MMFAIGPLSGRKTLIELAEPQPREDTGLSPEWNIVDVSEAHQWVRWGQEHQTGLFIDGDGVVQYAPAEGEE